MRDEFLKTQSGGDPIYFQHMMWILGQPSTWVTIFAYVVLFVGMLKLAKWLWRKKKRVWFFGFLLASSLAFGFYIYLSVNAIEFYRDGRAQELVALRLSKGLMLSLSFLSFCWILREIFRRKK